MSKKKKILFIDVETSPIIAYVWNRYNTNVVKVKRESELLTIAWKWLGDKKAQHKARPNFKPGTERPLVKTLRTLLDQADVVIGHNSRKFDVRRARADIAKFGLKPPSPFQQFDTCATAKSHFGFGSNKLDDLLQHLGAPFRKIKTGGIDLWDACMQHDKKAFAAMGRYNERDVEGAEWLFKRIRPYVNNHPAFYERAGQCPKCGGTSLENKGKYVKGAKKLTRLRCRTCSGFCYFDKQSQKISLAKRGGKPL